jgi:hypothetical protein
MFIVILCVLIAIFVVECLLLEVEHWGFATLLLVATGVGCQFLHVADIWGFITSHTVDFLLYVLAYLGTGVVWSFIKWFSFLVGFRDEFREVRDAWYSAHNLKVGDALTPEQQKDLDDSYCYKTYKGQALLYKPKAVKNKRRITCWMAYWPFSVVGTIINDPIRRLFKFLFNSFKALYQRIADHVFRNEVGMRDLK